MKNISKDPLEVDVTILKLLEPYRILFSDINDRNSNMESVIYPTPEKSPVKVKDKKK
jgi:hypothetical protein